MKSISRMTQAELAAYVQSHLETKGIKVILSGGAAVAIYSENKYVSADIDLVNAYNVERKKIAAAMQEIGFYEENRYFKHPDTKHIVEFPPGPLSVGDEPVKNINEIKFSTGILRVISETDCVKDRLAAYYFWKDQQSLHQAILVAKNSHIIFNEIKRWSRASGNMSRNSKHSVKNFRMQCEHGLPAQSSLIPFNPPFSSSPNFVLLKMGEDGDALSLSKGGGR